MANARRWSDRETHLFIYGYLYCPVRASLDRKAPWLIDYLHTTTGNAKYTVPQIVAKAEQLQQAHYLPPLSMKLPAEYTSAEISTIWNNLFTDLWLRNPRDVDRFDYVANMYCRVGDKDTLEDCLDRLCWLVAHLRGQGGFRLWSEPMRTAIVRLYETREDHGDDTNGANSTGTPSRPGSRRKYSNEEIINAAAVNEFWGTTCSGVDLAKDQLDYFLLDRIAHGDTSTRKKRLEYYNSYPYPQVPTNPPPDNAQRRARIIAGPFRQTPMIQQPDFRTQQQLAIQSDPRNGGPSRVHAANSVQLQVPSSLPLLAPKPKQASHAMFMQHPIFQNGYTPQPQPAASGIGMLANAPQEEQWISSHAVMPPTTHHQQTITPLPTTPAPTQGVYPIPRTSPAQHGLNHHPGHLPISRPLSAALQFQFGPGMHGRSPALGPQHGARVYKSSHQRPRMPSAVANGQPGPSRGVHGQDSPAYMRVTTPLAHVQNVCEMNHNGSNGVHDPHMAPSDYQGWNAPHVQADADPRAIRDLDWNGSNGINEINGNHVQAQADPRLAFGMNHNGGHGVYSPHVQAHADPGTMLATNRNGSNGINGGCVQAHAGPVLTESQAANGRNGGDG